MAAPDPYAPQQAEGDASRTLAALVPAFARIGAAHKLYVYLSAIFVSCLLLGDVIGGKIITTPLGAISVGIIPFPVTFLLTDIVNDFYGRSGARFLTLLGFFMAAFAWVLLQVTTRMHVDASTYFTQPEYAKIFGGSAQLFVASMIAYLIGQFLDIHVFQVWKALTQSRHLWLRATGSTIFSQVVDTVTINVIFGKVTAGWTWGFIFAKTGREYGIKLVVIVRVLRVEPEPHELRASR
jgi:uncharacterized integral membrane protein (TIGR00697 family)